MKVPKSLEKGRHYVLQDIFCDVIFLCVKNVTFSNYKKKENQDALRIVYSKDQDECERCGLINGACSAIVVEYFETDEEVLKELY